jgi:tetratricopeptide (TPR) repeat protein
LRPAVLGLSFEFSKKINVQQEIMKKYSALTLITALAVCVSQFAHAQGNKEANKLARDGAEASKNQDYDKAVELLRKATALDRKYAPDLAAVYQGRGYAFAKNQLFQEAIQDYTEAIKIKPNDPRIYEQRAAVEMKMYDYDKALADYSELIKLKPNEVRYLNYRAYIYEVKDDVQNSMADTEKVLKLDPNNQDAKTRKQRLEQKLAERMPLTPPPRASSPKASPAPAHTP